MSAAARTNEWTSTPPLPTFLQIEPVGHVSYRGDAIPCCMVGTPDRARFGNVLAGGVAAVWHNADYQHFRAELASNRAPHVCRSCAVY
jgi:radical SAM protein with 4Fe4S-binding SPASM domain